MKIKLIIKKEICVILFLVKIIYLMYFSSWTNTRFTMPRKM